MRARIKFTLFFVFLISDVCLGWTTKFFSYPFAPEKFLAVDKEKQKLFVVESKSPLKKKEVFACKTGENKGDKWKEGDKKTPEGVYFIEGKISKGINVEKYGELAFILNYPNPVDVIKGKKGHGIWIHGRGYLVDNYRTKGCVALSYYDIRKLKKDIKIGKTPVIIAKRIDWVEDKFDERLVYNMVLFIKKWANLWSEKNKKFFDFYDLKFYSKNYKNIYVFKRQKMRFFKNHQWIDVSLYDPKIIFGPDYIVTYFYQAYVCPGFSSFGIKRLYWMKKDNKWKIVGEEWRNIDSFLVKSMYLKDRAKSILTWLNCWKDAWVSADLKRYGSFYCIDAVQQNIKGKDKILEYKKKIWAEDPPKNISIIHPKVRLTDKGFLVSFVQKYESKKGYKDKGKKKLLIIPNRGRWLIKSESWSRY